METTNAVVGVAIITIAGRWSQGKPLDIRIAIGMGALAIFLSAFNDVKPELASKFTVLILISALFIYGPDIFKKAGLIQK